MKFSVYCLNVNAGKKILMMQRCEGLFITSIIIRTHFLVRIENILIQSTPVISNSKGPSKTLRVIHSSTYQIYSIEEKNIKTTKFHK